jgi:hypothetical protein
MKREETKKKRRETGNPADDANNLLAEKLFSVTAEVANILSVEVVYCQLHIMEWVLFFGKGRWVGCHWAKPPHLHIEIGNFIKCQVLLHRL